ncbi:MAG: nitroreductase family protein [Deltaproteobacteria bacterium]|nr:nitroreductase family protein [Deltaproteobacteria bacterium]
MQDFSLDRSRCIQCGLCIYDCNRQVLVADGEGFPSLPAANFDQCNACGHCAAVCPTEAVISPKCDGERPMAFPVEPKFDTAKAETFLLSCRSMRRYKQEPVKKEDILAMLDVARRAPTASNLQTVRWVVLSGKDKAVRFSELTLEWFDKVVRKDPAENARYDVDGMLARYKGGYDVILRGALNAVFAVTDRDAAWGPVDASIAVTYFCLAAHARGIGSCWCGFGMRALAGYPPLRDFMGFDDSVAVQGMAFFGYPEVGYHALPPRKPLRVSWF